MDVVKTSVCRMKPETLLHKSDWPEARKRLEAFWGMEVLDRPCMAVYAPAKKETPAPPKDWESYWMDPATWLQTAEYYFSSTFFGGEALPHRVMLTPFAAPYGAQPVFDSETVWNTPCLKNDWRLSDIHFDSEGRWWSAILGLLAEVCQASKERFLVSFPTLTEPTDILAGIRGPKGLCIDMLRRPEDVKEVLDHLTECWKVQYTDCLSLISDVQDGTMGWLGDWSPGRNIVLSCDFSCMISPTLFNKFVKPELEELCSWLNKPMYHLDGPGAVHHLNTLLSIPDLGGIQWVPGAGAPRPIEWMWLLEKVQSAGKRLHIGVDPSDVEKALKNLKPQGLFLSTRCNTEDEAIRMLRTAEQHYKGHG